MIKTYIFLFFLFLFGAAQFQALAQIKLVRHDSIPVLIGNDTLPNAWAGGMNSPQFSEIDLNNDGKKDLFYFERDFTGVVRTFLNNGAAEGNAFDFDAYYISAFPPMSNWALLVDYNCDGKEDIFTDVPFGAAVYRNDSDAENELKFTKVSSLLKSSTPEGIETLYVASTDIPAITDVDEDGDMDILVFSISGSTVEYHKNMSMELYGDCEHLEFELKNRCWGYFSENDNSNGITLYDTCPENVPYPEKDSRHAGSTVLALDLNGDLVKELVLGDLTFDNLVMISNGGSLNNASMTAFDSAFPSNSVAADLTVFPAAFHLDLDNDGIKDLLVSPNNPVRSENVNNVWFYKNQGSDLVPEFVFKSAQFLQDGMIDVGSGARPVFFDHNKDGLLDMVVGNYGYFIETSLYDSKLALYENIGNETAPAFQLITNDYAGLSSIQLKGVYPAFGDLDNDGVLEMLAGDEEGRLHLFKDFSADGAPADFVLTSPNYKSIDIGETAMPQIVDVNRDGKPDILIGERGGTIDYFENIGTVAEADFGTLPTNDFFGEIDMMIPCCTGYSSPLLTKDSSNNSILYVGSEKGRLYLYDQIDDNLDGPFRLLDSLNLFGLRTTISGGDIDHDGSEEIVYGEFAGGIGMLTYGLPSFLDVDEVKSFSIQVHIYPNPATDIIHVEMQNAENISDVGISLLDIYGRVQLTQKFREQTVSILDVRPLNQGVYFLAIESGHRITVKKVVIR